MNHERRCMYCQMEIVVSDWEIEGIFKAYEVITGDRHLCLRNRNNRRPKN